MTTDTKELVELLKHVRDALDTSEPYRPNLVAEVEETIRSHEAAPEKFDYLSVYESIHKVLDDLKDGGVIGDAELFRRSILETVEKSIRAQLEGEQG